LWQAARKGFWMKTLLSESDLRAGVARLATEINAYYLDRPLTIIGVLTGSVVLLADLIRLLEMPLRVGVVQASSYRGAATTRGSLHINHESMPDIARRDVLLVDDIYDTGHTLAETVRLMRELGPASVRTCVLLLKRGRQEISMAVDHVGFEIPNEFVVGYGLDYQDEYRNLPYLAALEECDLASGQP
jgi:hypoxanthine phosphoribosyltransferase